MVAPLDAPDETLPEPHGRAPEGGRAGDAGSDPTKPDPPLGRRIRYLPGLDGLRGLAVLAVVGYHADLYGSGTGVFRGGFLGVEVFFVISGYLITSILLRQWRAEQRIDLLAFYRNRARRLLPALALTMGGTIVLSVVLLPDEVAALRGDAIASAFYVVNWFFIVTDASYFEAVGRPSLLQHLWSLAVEEQFYLLWPALFALGMRRLGRRGVLVASIAAALASATLMAVLHAGGADVTRIYEGTDTRVAGLFVGVALAFVWSPTRLRAEVGAHAPLVLDIVGGAAALGLIGLMITTDAYEDSLYRFGFLRVAILSAVVIAIAVHPASRLGRWLGWRPLAWVGLRSYGIYLYHWPIFQLTRPGLDVPLDGPLLAVIRIGLTFGLAELSFRYLEAPIRHGALRRWWRAGLDALAEDPEGAGRWRGLAAVAGLVAVLTLGMAVLRAQPPDVPEYLAAGSTGGGLPPPPPSVTTTATRTATVGGTLPVPVGPPAAPTTTTAPPSSIAAPAPPPAPARRVTALGDSVMLGAVPALQGQVPGDVFVDAAVSRQMADALAVLRAWRDGGRLGDVVVVHLGNNGPIRPHELDELLGLVAGAERVVLVNVRVPRPWEGHNNELIARGAASQPNAVLADWHTASASGLELFQDDGLHLRPDGAARYAALIAGTV